jgi:biotin carboxyl carrier protein
MDLISADMLRVREAYAQNIVMDPAPGVLLSASPAVSSPVLKAISIDLLDPFKMDFLVDAGDRVKVDEKESSQLIKYFLTFLTIPEEALWVNLSPSEPDRIVDPALGGTPVGEDMLKQDYLLKQLSASMTFPDRAPGKAFWEQVYSSIKKQYGNVDLPLNTFSKVWVVPEKAVVYEHNGTAFIAESRLKVMLDKDYLTMKDKLSADGVPLDTVEQTDGAYLAIAREIIIPALQREVDEGEYFSQLRQMFNSLVLAIWFKRKLKGHVVNKIYTDQKKLSGVQIVDKQITQKVYAQYMEALKKGVYDFIREDYDADQREVIPRHYFSGGFSFMDAAQRIDFLPSVSLKTFELTAMMGRFGKNLSRFSISLIPRGMSRKSLLTLAFAAGLLFSSPAGSGSQSSGQAPFSAPVNSSHVIQASQHNIDQGNTIAPFEVSQGIISRGDTVPQEDRKYFSFMKDFLNAEDVKGIQGKENPLTGQKYDFDAGYIERNWNKLFSSSTMGWAQEALVVVVQNKLGIQEDGDFGPQTRMSLEGAMSGIRVISASELGSGGKKDAGLTEEIKPVVVKQEKKVVLETIQKKAPVEIEQASPEKEKPVVLEKKQPVISQTAGSPPPPPPKNNKEVKMNTLPLQKTLPSQTNVMVAPVNGGYTVSTQTAVTLDEIGLTAQSGGIVTGLDQNKREYQQGEVIFRLVDPEAGQQRSELNDWLRIQKDKLAELQALSIKGAASGMEISVVQEKIAQISQQLARLDVERGLEVVKAPCRLFARDILVSNGMTVNKGAGLINYLAQRRVRLSLELPLTQNYFGRIRNFRIDGRQVSQVVSVDWRLNPQKTRAIVTFLVEPSSDIQMSKTAKVEAEFLPPLDAGAGVPVKGKVQTIAVVRSSQNRVIVAPADGAVQFFVKEGDQVKKGQLLAIQGGSSPSEYNRTLAAYKSVKAQLEQAGPAEGVSYIQRDELVALQEKEASLKAQLLKLKAQAGRLKVTAPESGIVVSLAAMTSSAFSAGDEILRVKTSKVIVGDVYDMNNAVLVPDDLDIQVNDPVLIQTPSGEYIPARISNINMMPVNGTMTLTGVKAVELQADDPNNALWENLPVRVIIPAEDEKTLVLDMFHRTGNTSGGVYVRGQGKTIPGPLKQEQTLLSFIPFKNGNSFQVPAESISYQKGDLSLGEMALKISGNDLLNGGFRLDLLKNKEAERYTQASKFNLSLGVIVKDNKLSFSGGIGGIFQGLTTVKKGAAISAALPTVYNLSGELINKISGQEVKQEDLALAMTEIALHHMEDAVSEQVTRATGLFIDIGNAKNQVAQLQALLVDLQKARDVIAAREAGSFSVTADKDVIDQKIADVRSKFASLQNQVEQWSIELNSMLDMPLTQGIFPDLLWDGEFLSISEDEQRDLSDRLQGESTPSYRLKKALAVLSAMEKTIELQKFKLFPSADLVGLYLPEREARFEIPLLDKRTGILQEIMDLERQKVELNLKSVKAVLDKELTQAVSDIRDLSRQIAQAEADHENAYKAWKRKADRSDFYRADQMVTEREAVAKSAARLVDLKAQYFKAEARLRQMQLLVYEGTYVRAAEKEIFIQQQTLEAVGNAVVTEPGGVFVSGVKSGEGSDGLLEESGRGQGLAMDQGNVLSAGAVTYASLSAATGSTGLWPLMTASQNPSEDQFDAVLSILTQDPNIMTRMQTLDLFLQERQNSRKFISTAEQVVLNSPYPDVVQKLLVSMSKRDGCDPRFFIYVVDEALRRDKPVLAETGFRVLNDMFVQDPGVLQRFSELNYSPRTGSAHMGMALENVRKVLLTFLAWAPDDWAGKVRLLQSEYWTEDQLAQIYNTLIAGKEPGSERLAPLIKDEILRRLALHNIVDVYNKGSFQNLTGIVIFSRDVYASFMREKLRDMNSRFLIASPAWRDMKDHISPDLYERADKGTSTLLSSAEPLGTGSALLYQVPALSQDDTASLAYFDALSLDLQEKYIAGTKSFPELARIFESPTPLRSMALDRLMMTVDGRILVLQVYARSNDTGLLDMVEARDWIDPLRMDVPAMADPVSTDILRRSLEKMHARMGEEWPLNIRLKTFTFGELHKATDPRGADKVGDQIKAMATELALDLVEGRINSHARFAFWSNSKYSSEEIALINEIRQRINSGNDPEEITAYLEYLQPGNLKKKGLLGEIMAKRDKLVVAISANDQSLPNVPSGTLGAILIAALIAGGVVYQQMKKKLRLQKAGVDESIGYLRDEFSVDSRNGGREIFFVAVIPDEGLYVKTGLLLKRWEGIVRGWNKKARMSESPVLSDPQGILNGFNEILNQASRVLEMTAYSPELMGKVKSNVDFHNEEYRVTLSYFNLLAVDTLNVLDQYLKDHPQIDELQKEYLLRDIKWLTAMMRYVQTYLDVLECRGIIDKVMSYKLKKDHFLEKSRIYSVIRTVLLYSYLWDKAKKRLEENLPKLLEQGESVLPGIYGGPDSRQNINDASIIILKDMTAGGAALSSALRPAAADKHKMRSFWTRARLMGTIFLFTMSFFLAVLGIGLFSLPVTMTGFVGVGIGLGLFWVPHLNIMAMSWSKVMGRVITELESRLYKTLMGDKQEGADRNTEEKIVHSAVQDGREALEKELNAATPGVDMIVILPEDPAYVDSLGLYVKDSRGRIFRDDIPVEVVGTAKSGSANIYFEALQYVQKKTREEKYLDQYPHLKGRSMEELRVIFVFHGDNKKQNNSALDWGVVNGYRVARAMRESENKNGYQAGGQIVIYSRDAYFGPSLKLSDDDVNLLGDRVAKDELKSLGLLSLDFNQNDGNQVQSVLEKLDIAKLEGDDNGSYEHNKVLGYLKENYDLSKPDLRQFPALAGVMVFRPRIVEILGKVSEELKNDPDLWNKLPHMQMTVDVLNNLIRPLTSQSALAGYLEKRISFSDIERHYGDDLDVTRRSFRDFYKLFRDVNGGDVFTGHAVLPHDGTVKLIHIKEKKDALEIKKLLKQAGFPMDQAQVSPEEDGIQALSEPDSSQVPVENGGLDFSGIENNIEFKEGQALAARQAGPVHSARSLQFLQLFRGFDFKIMALQPLEDPRMFLFR